ncbi:hypothetical protein [Saccharopolyspora endophytica]|uniref:hypothetical protein n=1 Tax=Saccharopolyspora endophytica TaxID=543886 RepID=UPI001B36A825|nr:hypothetical protein [Saccharopolyspora endophytica]
MFDASSGLGKSVGLGAGFDDGSAEGEAVDDRCGYLDFDFRILPLTWYFVSWTGVFD